MPGTQQELSQHGFPWSMDCGEDLPQMPIATGSHTLPMGPVGPGLCRVECGEGPQLQLSHGPGQDICLQPWLLASSKALSG